MTDALNAPAVIDRTGAYRYWLRRDVDMTACNEAVLFVMFNPSTADHRKDDPTIRRCIGFARTWGYKSLGVVNLFAYRATDPKTVDWCRQHIGPENDEYILAAARWAREGGGLVVTAWGAYGHECIDRRNDVLEMLADHEIAAHRIGPPTARGAPRHPLYLRGTLEPVPY